MADSRHDLSCEFLAQCGWGNAQRKPLAGDASDRRYERLTLGAERAVLMDAPPGTGDDPADFVRIGGHLQSLGLSSPVVMAKDFTHGFLLLEDLGDDLFARVLEADQGQELSLYLAATDVLLHLQSHPAPAGLPDLSARDWAEAAAFALDWYRFAATGLHCAEDTRGRFIHQLERLIGEYADGSRVLILRDFHAENMLVLPGRAGLKSVGLLDFQLGQMGQPCYDLVSMLQDARRDVSPDVATACINHFAQGSGREADELRTEFAVFGAQRALRILGIFARLCVVRGKADYPKLMPRVWAQLQENLTHPALAEFRRICNDLLPEPTPTIIEGIRSKCATISP